MRTAATIRTTVKLAVSALAVAAAGMTLAPLERARRDGSRGDIGVLHRARARGHL